MDYVDLGTFSSTRRRRSARHNRKKTVFLAIAVLLVVLLGWGIYKVFWATPSVLAQFWSSSGTVLSYMLPGSSRLKQDQGVTNVLLVGIDRRSVVPYTYAGPDGEIERNSFLADTIIITSVNRNNESISMLSLPRDLWVEIPPFGSLQRQFTKINSAHALGDRFGEEENGGMKLLKKVVEEALDIPIHYWARIDFEGFEKGVDAIGGIDIIVERSFDDYMFPVPGCEDCPWEQRWEHVHFDQGLQHMDGETALKFARSRHAIGPEGSDFARAKRQQKVILAVKNKAISSPENFNPARIKELYEIVADNLYTDFKLTEIPLAVSLVDGYVDKEVQTYSLVNDQHNLLVTPTDLSVYGGAWVLIPQAGRGDYSAIQEFVEEIFYPSESGD